MRERCGAWRECAVPTCRRLFHVREGVQRCCCRSCARALDHMMRNPALYAAACERAEKHDKIDIFDRKAILAWASTGPMPLYGRQNYKVGNQ